MREPFLCGAFARPDIHPREGAGTFGQLDIYCRCGACDLPRTPRSACGSVIPLRQIGSRKALVAILVVPDFQGPAIKLLVSVSTHSVPE
jgi:hypothetical protein